MDALTYAESVLWAPQNATNDAKVRDLESQLQAARAELAGVKQELADKVEQLGLVTSTSNQHAFDHNELEHQLQVLATTTVTLEGKLAQRDKELEELRRAHSAQKKALREAQEAVSERNAAREAEQEVCRTAAQLVLDEELERLAMSLTELQTRSQMELAAKEREVKALRSQLQGALQQREDAVKALEASMAERLQQELEQAQRGSASRITELEEEVVRLRTRLEDMHRAEQKMDLPRELAALNNRKVQIQRELEAMKELTARTSQQNREEVARLLDENATLRTKIATLTLNQIHARTATAQAAHTASMTKARTFLSERRFLPSFLVELDRQRQGLAPMGLIAIIVVLVVLLAIVRAAIGAHGAHPGLCFLSKLGIQIGAGCGDVVDAAKHQLEKIIEKPQRVHDVPTSTNTDGVVAAGRTLLQLMPEGRWRAG